jgi:hypothetical protein
MALKITEHCFIGIISVPALYGCMLVMEEGVREDSEDSLKLSGNEEGGGGRETSSLSLVNLKCSEYGPFLPARQYIFHNGNSYFHFRHFSGKDWT